MEDKSKFSKLREQQRETRKNLIIDAAEMVFMKKHFNEVSIRKIAKEAGITPTSIYRYFPDKQHLFCAAYERDAQKLLKVVAEAIGDGKELKIEELSMKYIEFFRKYSQSFKILANFTIDEAISEDCTIMVNLVTRPIIDQVERYFKNFQPDIDARVLARSYFAAINGVLISYQKYPGKSEDQIWGHMRVIAGAISKIFTCYLEKNATKGKVE
jgi:AcrR family transcriptional regulator